MLWHNTVTGTIGGRCLPRYSCCCWRSRPAKWRVQAQNPVENTDSLVPCSVWGSTKRKSRDIFPAIGLCGRRPTVLLGRLVEDWVVGADGMTAGTTKSLFDLYAIKATKRTLCQEQRGWMLFVDKGRSLKKIDCVEPCRIRSSPIRDFSCLLRPETCFPLGAYAFVIMAAIGYRPNALGTMVYYQFNREKRC